MIRNAEHLIGKRLFYGWVIVVGSFIISFSFGIFYSFGVFFKALQNEFALDRTWTSLIPSISTVTFCISGVIIGRINDRLGVKIAVRISGLLMAVGIILSSFSTSLWSFLFFYGIVASSGSGVVFTVPSSLVYRWFLKRRGLFLGITLSGIGAGTSLLSPLFGYLISKYAWQELLFMTGILSGGVLFFVSIFLISSPEQLGQLPYGDPAEGLLANRIKPETRKRVLRVFRAKAFWSVFSVQLFACIPLHFVYVHIVPYITDTGIDLERACLSLSVIAFSSFLGRIVIGFAGDFVGWRMALFGSGAVCSLSLISMMVLKAHGNTYTYILLAVFGFFYGGKAPLLAGLIGSLFGGESLAEIFGYANLSEIIGGLTGPLIGGIVFDRYGNYDFAFIISAISYAVSALAAIYPGCGKPCTNSR